MAARESKLTVVVVDDEAPARLLLREHLERHGGAELVAECANGFEAVKAVTETSPDLLLLDVQMPKLDGFEVLELLGDEQAVVFTTAYDEYALKAFEVHAVDYLLKPIGYARFAEAMDRAAERLARGERILAEPAALAALAALAASARRGEGPLGRVLVRDGARIHVLAAEEIDYVEARDDAVAFRCRGADYTKQQTLTAVEEALDPRRFVRIHRSYLLNVERLERLELYAKDSRVAILTGGTKLPVSRSGYGRLKELL